MPDISRRTVLAALAAAPLGHVPRVVQSRAPRLVIRTLSGDLDPGRLRGTVLFHEHLSMRFPLDAAAHFTDDVALMADEARAARADGLALVVDGGHPDMHRRLEALHAISRDSGLPVVASGGYYMHRTYPPALDGRSAEAVADLLVAEAARDRLGAFGEIGQQGGVLTDRERIVFRAVGLAQVRTGLPVFTHNPYLGQRPGAADIPRDAALGQLDILERAGAALDKVAIGHVCCLHDPAADVAIAIARRGAFVGFDRVTLPIEPDTDKVIAVMALVAAGHADKLLLSSDFAAARALRKNGGPGLAQTATVFGPMLLQAGLPAATLRQILEDNPKRFLAGTPRV
ncbi:MAG: hypothetical protein AB7U83_20865 [Vicinamibacterales bacterium]